MNGEYVVIGDASSNQTTVGYDDEGHAYVNGTATTVAIDVMAERLSITRIVIDLGDGSDSVTIEGMPSLTGAYVISGGRGDDQITFEQATVGGQVDIRGRGGNDVVWFHRSTFTRAVSFNGGIGRDRVFSSSAVLLDTFVFGDLTGPSHLDLRESTFRSGVLLQTGNSVDRVRAVSSTFDDALHMIVRNGSDVIEMQGCDFARSPMLNDGGGDDSVTIS